MHGLRLKMSKCVFMQLYVESLGYQINNTELHNSNDSGS